MNLKEAKEVTGGLSDPSKMPCLMQLDRSTQDRFHQLERQLAGLTKYFGHLDKDRAELEHLGVY